MMTNTGEGSLPLRTQYRFLTLIQLEEPLGCMESVKRTRIRVIGVNFSDFVIKGKEISFELEENSSYPSSS